MFQEEVWSQPFGVWGKEGIAEKRDCIGHYNPGKDNTYIFEVCHLPLGESSAFDRAIISFR